MADKVTCEVSFTTGGRIYGRGTEYDPDDPIVKRYPSMFSTEVRATATVPGEVTSPPPTKRAAVKKTANKPVAKGD